MRKGLFMIGILVLITGILLSAVLYPGVGYDTADETADKLSGSGGLSGFKGISIKVRGVVADDYSDLEGANWTFDDMSVLYIEDLQIDGIPVLILSDNKHVTPGDEVTVEGYAFGTGLSWFVAGNTLSSASSSGSLDPADVEKVPHSAFYAGIVVTIVGCIVMMAGVGMMPKRG